MLPDTGERYLSSRFETIEEGMAEEEVAQSLSTPGFHRPTHWPTRRAELPVAEGKGEPLLERLSASPAAA